MSDPNDNSIPILQEVLVPGHAAQKREPQSGGAAPAVAEPADGVAAPDVAQPLAEATAPAAAQPSTVAAAPAAAQPSTEAASPATAPADMPLRESEGLHESGLQAEPELAPQPVLSPEETLAPEPVLAPQPAAVRAQPKIHSDDAHRAAEAEHAHDEVLAASAGVFDRTEPPPPLEAGATVPPDITQDGSERATAGVDAELIAGRLRERFATFLAGDGRAVVEERCRSAVQEHTSRLVDQITREVVLTLEKEMTGWVREAVEAEVARRTSGA
ncbi:DUF2486 family protein [Burkholderia sp. WSM2230]|uniref:DUF2486 family protein n=1 Tax=Burkholderia sp. WSM2230 TaxID=944435 RepID=UPI0003F73B8C|nr:DUF2486 family protein [Burkholderia sp. WSM2230]